MRGSVCHWFKPLILFLAALKWEKPLFFHMVWWVIMLGYLYALLILMNSIRRMPTKHVLKLGGHQLQIIPFTHQHWEHLTLVPDCLFNAKNIHVGYVRCSLTLEFHCRPILVNLVLGHGKLVSLEMEIISAVEPSLTNCLS